MSAGRRILVVDDETVIRTLCARLLRKLGLEPVMAGDASEAQRLIDEGPAFALLITDMGLPDGDGVGVALRFQKAHPTAGIVIFSGAPSRQDGGLDRVQEIGVPAEQVLLKPFDIEEFQAVVQRCLPR